MRQPGIFRELPQVDSYPDGVCTFAQIEEVLVPWIQFLSQSV
jgi:hypothetical protein